MPFSIAVRQALKWGCLSQIFRAATKTPPNLQHQAALLLAQNFPTQPSIIDTLIYIPNFTRSEYSSSPVLSLLFLISVSSWPKFVSPPLLAPCHTNQFQREGTKTAPHCFNCPEKLCQNWELDTPEPSPTSSQLWPGHPCCYPSTCCSRQNARWENWCLSASEELKICLLSFHRWQHTERGSWKLWSGAIALPSLPIVLHHFGRLACTITPFAKDKGKSYILCQDEKVPSLTNYTFHRNTNKVFWAQYWLSLPSLRYKNASNNSVDE